MKRFLTVFAALLFLSSFAWGFGLDQTQASLIAVSAKRHHVTRHRAHKAAKHPHPKRHRRSV